MTGAAVVRQARMVLRNGAFAEYFTAAPISEGGGTEDRAKCDYHEAPAAETPQIVGFSEIAEIAVVLLGDLFLAGGLAILGRELSKHEEAYGDARVPCGENKERE